MMEQDDIWDAYLLSFMFNALGGSDQRQIEQMVGEVMRFFTLLLTRLVRKPNSDTNVGKLPRLVACPEYPVSKRRKSSMQDVTINAGLHFQGILLVPKFTRLKVTLEDHIHSHLDLYRGSHRKLRDIYVKKVTTNHARVAEYTLKWQTRQPGLEEWMVELPRSRSEVMPATKRLAKHER